MASFCDDGQCGRDKMEPSRPKVPVDWQNHPGKKYMIANIILKTAIQLGEMWKKNIGIKRYRNAEVNGMEHHLCKIVEVSGNKNPARSYRIQYEMCTW